MRLRFTSRALGHFSSIAEYISREDAAAAAKVGARIRTVCLRLAEFPGIGRPGAHAGTRELSVPRLPYVVVYRVSGDEVVILGIYHSRQLRPASPGL